MKAEGIELRHAVEIDSVWNTLIDIYAEVRADQLHQPHYSVERYAERLTQHAAQPGWEVVVGYDGAEPVGYAYVGTLSGSKDRWWQRMTPSLPEDCTGTPTVALKEIMLRVPWRGKGIARRIHDDILAHRSEEQVILLVNALAGNGKVKTLYEEWGYWKIGEQQPSPDGPVLTAMLRATREPAPTPGNPEQPTC